MAEVVFYVVVGGAAALALAKGICSSIHSIYRWFKEQYIAKHWRKVTITINQNPTKFKKLSDQIYNKFGQFRNYNDAYNFSIIQNDNTRKQYFLPRGIFNFDQNVQIEPYFQGVEIAGYYLWAPVTKEQDLFNFNNELEEKEN